MGVAIVLEGLQLVTPDRHARFADTVVKAAGGTTGVVVAFIVMRLTRAIDRLG